MNQGGVGLAVVNAETNFDNFTLSPLAIPDEVFEDLEELLV
ncbi:MAG: hypothetical protein R3C11_17170 [Planctomycetaceae bacterium]